MRFNPDIVVFCCDLRVWQAGDLNRCTGLNILDKDASIQTTWMMLMVRGIPGEVSMQVSLSQKCFIWAANQIFYNASFVFLLIAVRSVGVYVFVPWPVDTKTSSSVSQSFFCFCREYLRREREHICVDRQLRIFIHLLWKFEYPQLQKCISKCLVIMITKATGISLRHYY